MMRKKITLKISGAAVAAALLILACPSCESIYDDLDACPQGVSLHFVYDYNMEYADAFPKKVDCLTLYVYDGEGNFVTSRTETGEALASGSYRMTLDLEPGDYHFVAYGGMACDKASFAPVSEPTQGSTLASLQTRLRRSGDTSDEELHGFYFGDLDMTVTEGTATYDEGTVYMMKNTNNVRVMLEQLSGEPESPDDFTFAITDDNTLFACDNSLIPNGTVTYLPWATGQQSTGTRADDVEGDEDDDVVTVAYAELSCSRLATGNSPRLTVRRAADGEEVINIPLINYLLLMKSEAYSKMGSQEFLDRQSEWTMLFFLDASDTWISTRIVINDWVVRINDASMI
ncbi:MAG: FimB/Mfa2 family fimbrial subunit [Prevotellaceae bacterium]|nr:FimB/Mfa2 family fimbrial subunit [Prevotellaceae bacterium]